MYSETEIYREIDQFRYYLNRGELHLCWEIYRRLCQQGDQKGCCEYLKCLLDYTLDHDVAKAQRRLLTLTTQNLPTRLLWRVLTALAQIYYAQGSWQAAIDTYIRSEPYLGDQALEQATMWTNVAIMYRKGYVQGDFADDVLAQAEGYGLRALATLEAITTPTKQVLQRIGNALNTLGSIYMNQNALASALTCYQRDLRLCQESADDKGQGISHLNIGEVYQKLGNDEAALQAYGTARRSFQHFNQPALEADVLANYAFLYAQRGDSEIAFTYYVQSIEVIEQLRRRQSHEEARQNFFATVSDIYANLVLLCWKQGKYQEAFTYVERARARALLDIISVGARDIEEMHAQQPLTLSEIQRRLPKDTVLLEYYTTGLFEAKGAYGFTYDSAERHRFPEEKTLLFAVTREQLWVIDTQLPPNTLLRQQDGQLERRHFLKPRMRRVLYDRLIEPIAELLSDKSTLFIVPHGPLHYMAFQALLSRSQRTLLEEFGLNIAYSPSATVLLDTRAKPQRWHDDSCLAIGYDGKRHANLLFAESEARSIAQFTGGAMLIGPDKKHHLIAERAKRYRWLHFACHGYFDPLNPLKSTLQISSDESLTAADITTELHLQCELVTLSACESGLSAIRRGDELIGFTRSFIRAGVPLLIVSLWRVSGPSTRIFMTKLFQELVRGTTAADALRVAQQYLRQLTRREVRDLLATFLVEDNSHADNRLVHKAGEELIKQLATEQASATLDYHDTHRPPMLTPEDDQIFSSPFYWAPFILISAQGVTAVE